MKILMTGGTGFVGSAIREYIVENNLDIELVITSRNPRPLDGAQVIKGTVSTCSIPSSTTHVIHLEKCGVDDTIGIVTATKEAGARLLFASSGAVYGSDLCNVSEKAKINPKNSYGIMKAISEQACLIACPDVIIARLFTFTGPHLPLDFGYAIGDFIRDGLDGKPIRVHKRSNDAYRSYMYTTDLAEWLFAILLRGSRGQAYNVGSEIVVGVRELAEIVSSVFPNSSVIEDDSEPSGLGGNMYVPSTERARALLSLNMKVGLREAIQRTIEWHRERYQTTSSLD